MYAIVDHPIHLRYCHFDEAPDLYGTRLRQLNLRGSVIPSVNLASTRIDGPLRMSRCRVRGPVRLGGAEIAGALFLDGAELTTSDPSVPVLQLHQSVLGDGFAAPGLRVRGETRLEGATVGGSITLDESDLSNPGGHALCARSLDVRADIRARNLRTRGIVDLRGSRIAGSVDFTGPAVQPRRYRSAGQQCTIGELWLYRCEPIEGRLICAAPGSTSWASSRGSPRARCSSTTSATRR